MSDASSSQKTTLDLNAALEGLSEVDAQDVVDYLLSHPDFFADNPDLLDQISIPHEHKGSVSLVELQSEQLRQKVRLLSRKLNQLITIAKQNEKIYRVYADLNLRLLSCKDLSEVEHTLTEVMQEELKLMAVSLKPFHGANALPEIQQRLFVEKRFKQASHFFGRISQHESSLLFEKVPVQSVALLLLGDKNNLGILAIGSKDPGHFNPDMDTLLIDQLQQFLSVILTPMLDI